MRDPIKKSLAALAQLVDVHVSGGTALGNWRWTVRQRLAAVKEGLATETATATDGWLVAREGNVLRERTALMTRLGALAPAVLQNPDVNQVRIDLKRIIADIDHHLQRLRDIAYDDVEIELGGSE